MIELKYSTFWPRFRAGFIDGLIFTPVGWLFSSLYSATDSTTIRILIFTLNTCAYPAYSVWMHGTRGQTLGKMACDVVVLDVSERRLSLKQAALRDILTLVLIPVTLIIDIPRILQGVDVFDSRNQDMSPMESFVAYSSAVWFLIEILTMLTNNKRRALHDLIAGSVVIRTSVRLPAPIGSSIRGDLSRSQTPPSS